MLLLLNAGQNNLNTYIANSQAMMMASQIEATDPDDPAFIPDNDMGSTMQTINESGSTLPYLRKGDTSTAYSSSLKHRTYLYFYKNTTDPLSSPLFKLTEDVNTDELFMNAGNTSGVVIDDAKRVWVPDTATDSAVNSGKLVAGYVTANAGTTGVLANTISNAGSNTQALYQTYREAANVSTPIEYTIYAEPGRYLVQLYFAELDNTVTTSSPHRRAMDIYVGNDTFANILAGSAATSNFSPYAATGNSYNKAIVLSSAVTVGNSVPYISIALKGAAAGTDLAPRLQGVSMSRM